MAEFNIDDMWDDFTIWTETDLDYAYGYGANVVGQTLTVEVYDDEGNVVETKTFKLVEVEESEVPC